MSVRTKAAFGLGRARGGFTLLEMLVATAILLLLAGMLLQSLLGLRHASASGATNARIQDRGQKAMRRIVTDLRVSGFIDQPAGFPDYPYMFQGGAPDPLFVAHAHVPAAKQAAASEYDFGANREIVFRLPAGTATTTGSPTSMSTATWCGTHANSATS